MKKQKQSKCKVKCTITISSHIKICYPFKGTFEECRMFIYSTAYDKFINLRRSSNLQHFFGLSRFDDTGLLFFTITRAKDFKERIKLLYEIKQNNSKTKHHD